MEDFQDKKKNLKAMAKLLFPAFVVSIQGEKPGTQRHESCILCPKEGTCARLKLWTGLGRESSCNY